MSYVPGSADADWWAVFGGIAATSAALVGWTARVESSPGRVIAECRDGSVIGIAEDRVRRRAGRTTAQRARLRALDPAIPWRDLALSVREDLKRGDLCAARARYDEARRWVVEGLDAGREYLRVCWEFETEDEAARVLQLLNQSIVRPPTDAAGKPSAVAHAEFDAARDAEPLSAGNSGA